MTIHLSEDLQRFIHAKVRSGQFASEDAAVAAAIQRFRLWEQEPTGRQPLAVGDAASPDPALGSIGSLRDVADAYRQRLSN